MKFGLSVLWILLAAPLFAQPVPGVARLADTSLASRPLNLSIWYPSDAPTVDTVGGNAVFAGIPAAPTAPRPAGPLPLVVLTHGGLRSTADSGAWLAAGLAQEGVIVVEVSAPRPHNGAEALDEIWQRPRDIRRVIDLMLEDMDWGGRIDQGRIVAVGFALGATASLSVTGMELDVDAYLAACSAPEPLVAGPDCAWLAAGGRDLAQTDRSELAAIERDPRVRAAVAIEPEYVTLLRASEGQSPALLITLGQAPEDESAAGFSQHDIVADAALADGFGLCTPMGRNILREDGGDPALCGRSDDARQRAHNAILDAIHTFVQHLSSQD